MDHGFPLSTPHPFRYQLYQPKEKGFIPVNYGSDRGGSERSIRHFRLWIKENREGGVWMTVKLGITILLVAFILGSVIWLNLRKKKK